MSLGFSKMRSAKAISDVGACSVSKVKEGGGGISAFRWVFAVTGAGMREGSNLALKYQNRRWL